MARCVGGARGIFARNYGTSLSINAAGASGVVEGIGAYNHGSGSLTITTTGTVSGGSIYGLIGKGYLSGLGVTIHAQNVAGGTYGVVGVDYGPGVLSITTTGTVTGSNGTGIFAYSAYGSGVTVKTYGPVTGSVNGVYAKLGAYAQAAPPVGALSITAAGSVTGTTGAGIDALNFGQAGSTTSITVTSTGFVQGRIAGVFAYSKYGAPIAITNNGVIQNLSGASTDVAIATNGGPATIVNNGTITGEVNISGPAASAMTNNGTWNVAGGTNAFGGADTLTAVLTPRRTRWLPRRRSRSDCWSSRWPRDLSPLCGYRAVVESSPGRRWSLWRHRSRPGQVLDHAVVGDRDRRAIFRIGGDAGDSALDETGQVTVIDVVEPARPKFSA